MLHPTDGPYEVAWAALDANEAVGCEYAGHSWTDAGGGLLICAVCEAEKWADALGEKEETG